MATNRDFGQSLYKNDQVAIYQPVKLLVLELEKKTLLVGSNANNGSKAGLANFNSNNDVGNANSNISFRCLTCDF